MNTTFFKEYNKQKSDDAKEIAELIGSSMKNYFYSYHINSYIANSIRVEGTKVYIDAPKYNMYEVAKKSDLRVLKFDSSSSYADELNTIGAKVAIKDKTHYGQKLWRVHIVQTDKHKDYVEIEIMFAIYKWADKHGYTVEGYTEE